MMNLTVGILTLMEIGKINDYNKTMKHSFFLFLVFISSLMVYSQSVDDHFSKKNMVKDLQIFRNIREEANSGLYKYRTRREIDSIYNWATQEIEVSKTYRDFYNIICALTDFEGSLHNDTSLPDKYYESLRSEKSGFFPYPIKLIEGKLILNISNKEIPLGAEIVAINNNPIGKVLPNLYKYYTTDGVNVTGKSIGINYSFSKYYRLHYGLTDSFNIKYKPHNSNEIKSIALQSTSYKNYYKNVENRYSKPFDELDYLNYNEFKEKFSYREIDSETAILTINTFVIGWHAQDKEHLAYVNYLDSVFTIIKNKGIENLIVDVRHNGGGTDPNDLVTYSYLAQRNFSENNQAWISFKKIPYLKYTQSKIPAFIRPLGALYYNRAFKKEFNHYKNGQYYQDSTSLDHKIRTPNRNAFTGYIYLLISPRVASAGSLFSAMLAGNDNSITIGEESMGGYYGHNGHTPLSYVLPKSKLIIDFSIVNLSQNVPAQSNQIVNRGIIPDYNVPQTYNDFLNQKDTQMNFVLYLINNP